MRPKKIVAAALCALMLALSFVPASARSDGGSIEISHGCESVKMHIFHVGEPKGGHFVLCGDFEDLPVSLNISDQGGWRDCAETLENYALKNGLEPLETALVRDGSAVFSGLEPGLYLIVCPQHTDGNWRCEVQPMLVALPGEDGGTHVYCEAKSERERVPERDETVTRSVKKVWRGGEPADSVTVQLLRDGRVWAEAVLSAENGWRHEWRNLDARYSWHVVEDEVPEGYTVEITRDGAEVTITNTAVEPPPELPEGPETPAPTPNSPPPSNEKLPQTGQNAYLPPALALLGAGLRGVGRRRKGKK